jgi:hypothetical protein
MSHISKIEVDIKDLATLSRACQALGLTLTEENQFRYYNGYAPCDHVIRIPDARYEVGVVRKETGYTLQWDDWHSGGLTQALGPEAGRLKQAYAVERVRTEARRRGMRVQQKAAGSTIQLVLSA